MATGGVDTSIALLPYFKVKDGQMEAFQANFAEFYSKIKPQEEHMLTYGFAVDNANGRVFCRESYADAEGLLKHLEHVDAPLKAGLALSELERLEVHGPAAELEKVRAALTPLGAKFYLLETASQVFQGRGTKQEADTAVFLLPRFEVPAGKMADFKAGFQAFYQQIKPADEDMLYYGFAVDEVNSKAFCREAYKDAAGVLKHLGNVDSALKAALAIASLENLEVHGPAAELAKLREALTPLGCKFFDLDTKSQVYPGRS